MRMNPESSREGTSIDGELSAAAQQHSDSNGRSGGATGDKYMHAGAMPPCILLFISLFLPSFQ